MLCLSKLCHRFHPRSRDPVDSNLVAKVATLPTFWRITWAGSNWLFKGVTQCRISSGVCGSASITLEVEQTLHMENVSQEVWVAMQIAGADVWTEVRVPEKFCWLHQSVPHKCRDSIWGMEGLSKLAQTLPRTSSRPRRHPRYVRRACSSCGVLISSQSLLQGATGARSWINKKKHSIHTCP